MESRAASWALLGLLVVAAATVTYIAAASMDSSDKSDPEERPGGRDSIAFTQGKVWVDADLFVRVEATIRNTGASAVQAVAYHCVCSDSRGVFSEGGGSVLRLGPGESVTDIGGCVDKAVPAQRAVVTAQCRLSAVLP